MDKSLRQLADWEQIYTADSGAHKNQYPNEDVVRFLFKYIGSDDLVLDLGCGWGNNLEFVLDEGRDAIGIDISPTACQQSRTITPNVVQGDFTRLPFATGTFDAIVDRNSIQCNTLDSVEAALKDSYRVLSSGGQLYSIILAATSDPGSFHAYYLQDSKEELTYEDIQQLYAPFDELAIDEEYRTFGDGALSLRHYHVRGRKD